MDLRIRGRKALLAGASAGIGKSTATFLAREGAEVVISARTRSRLISAAAEIEAQADGPVAWVVADHSTVQGREELLASCPEPDILVVTCSPPRVTPDLRQVTTNEWKQSIEVGMMAPIALMQSVMYGMAERGWGRILCVTSVAVRKPSEARLLSGPSRAALTNVVVAMAREMAKYNVVLNTIMPGMCHTDGFRARYERDGIVDEDEYRGAVSSIVDQLSIPAGRFAEPDEIGAFCAMLCSDHASFLVGQSLVLDGGAHQSLF